MEFQFAEVMYPSFSFRHVTNGIIALCAGTFCATSSAALLLDTAGSTVLASWNSGSLDKDDGVATTGESFDAPFFGNALLFPFPNISFNGHIYFGNGDGAGDYEPAPLDSLVHSQASITRISPLWTDLVMDSSSQVLQTVGSSSSYNAITWVNMQGGVGNEGFVATFQAIYFNAAATIRGIAFGAGDIVFSYGDIINYDTPADIIIGIDKGTGAFATLPGYESTGGWAASYQPGMTFPVDGDDYVLFRPNGSGYDVSLQPIPEPSATTVALLSGLLVACRRRR